MRVDAWMTPSPHTVMESDTVAHAEQVLRTHGIRHLPVLLDGRLSGVVSERDLFVAARFAKTGPMAIRVIMTPGPYAVKPSESLGHVARQLHDRNEDAAVVVDDEGHVLGVFTAVDALRALAAPAAVEPTT